MNESTPAGLPLPGTRDRYRRIFSDGTVCICTPDEEQTLTAGLEGFTVSDVWLTRQQWEKLPDFGGW
jgi:hypothetical protein